jgi:hypothetical protein
MTHGATERWPARRALFAVALPAVAAVALLASACGSSSSEGVAQVDDTSTTTTGSNSQSGSGSGNPAAYATCMRRNGVPNYPSRSAEGTARYAAAKEACARYAPTDGDGPSPQDRARQIQLLLKWATCMRRNGLPNFPDPEPDPREFVKISREELTALGLDPSSPKFRAAEAACKRLAP